MGLGVRLGSRGEDNAADKAALIEKAAEARQAEAQGGEPSIIPILTPLGDNPTEEARKVYDYYMTPRAQHPRSENKQPVLIVAGEKSAQMWQAEALFKALDGNNKGLKKIIMPNGGHVDFYDQDEYVNPTVDDIVSFFKPLV
ncbi:hypothetical protein F5X68DRAFT_249061 [Plectosphaerella plurivora]|uniref:Alpha/beta hydrolase n=1 Tax=Plectosphaerella plurivora TaxID=936078 RepID=A0A9P8V3T5_9PEZI|nr:hypothetical protein F5X68DRAFT_249061 [Plectosphaerella plurivora]